MMKNEKELKAMIIDSIDSSLMPDKVAAIKMEYVNKRIKPNKYKTPLLVSLSSVLALSTAVVLVVSGVINFKKNTGNNNKGALVVEALKGKTNELGFGVYSAINAVGSLNNSNQFENITRSNSKMKVTQRPGGDPHDHDGRPGWGFDDHQYSEEESRKDADALLNILNPYLPSISNKVYGKDNGFEVYVSDKEEYDYLLGNFYFSFTEENIEDIVYEKKPEDEHKKVIGREIVPEEEIKTTQFSIKGVLIDGESSIPVYGEYFTCSYEDDSLECLDLYVEYSENEILIVSQFKYNVSYYERNFEHTYFSKDENSTLVEEQFESLSFSNLVYDSIPGRYGESRDFWRLDSYIEFCSIKDNYGDMLFASLCSSTEVNGKNYQLTADLSFDKYESDEYDDAVNTSYNMFISSDEKPQNDIDYSNNDHFGEMFDFGYGFDHMTGRRSHGEFVFAKNSDGNYVDLEVTPQGGEIIEDEHGDDNYDWFDHNEWGDRH